ncbi:CIA30 family protein [Phaeosphaeriaceae sp. PMI808]|nr:CIA30 family protein [Phaeosphaeriaceae sp. PMI808]
MEKPKELVLFGGEKGWTASDWTASDDRVRGGSSQSYLDVSSSTARFHGTLDITTLGGAGFASQRTTGDDRSWDLSAYDGIHLDISKTDGTKYTFVLKDEILPLDSETGREQSTISYEYVFMEAGAEGLYIAWDSLKPTYRGKPKEDASKLDLKSIKRLSIMSRSFFGEQEGDFSLTIKSIKAIALSPDLEGGIVGANNQNEPWSWKNSNLVGLGLILSTTWVLCFGFCWLKGIDTSHMTPSRWWRATGRRGFGV